jgi:lipopolysaccharide export system protein LptA
MKIYHKIFFLIALLLSSNLSAQTASLSLAGANHDISLPVEILANNLSIDQSTNSAIFEGSAYVAQGLIRLNADKIEVIYNQETSEVSIIKATGNVLFTNGEDIAEAKSAIYKTDNGLLKMTGNILLIQGKNTISGDSLEMNILNNTANLTGNVRTKLTPN